jgi:simple sugar transport system permease protein
MIERLLRSVVVPLVAIGIAVLAGMLFLYVAGYPVLSTFRAIIQQSFQDWYGFGQVLHATALLTFTGLAVAIAFQAGLFNIGVEGQLYMGAMALGIAGYYLKGVPKETIESIPWIAWMAGLIVISMLAAGAWAAIPGILKATTGAHEVITTIMMNFVAFAWINYFVRFDPNSFAVPATVRTPAFPQHLRMPRLSSFIPECEGSVVNCSVFLALAASFAVYAVLRFSKLGFELRAIGKNPVAARLAGIVPGRVTVLTMFLSGAVSGFVGIAFVLGHKGYFEEGFSAGLGFMGIAVALLAHNHPIGILFTAFLFGVLNYGKVAAAGEIPKDIIDVMEAAIIFSVVIVNKVFGNLLLTLRKRAIARADSTPVAGNEAASAGIE